MITCNPVFRVFTVCFPRKQQREYEWPSPREKKALAEVSIPQLVPSSSATFHVQPIVEINETPTPFYGRIRFRLDYDFTAKKLSVTIVECKDLPAMDRNGMSDPYIKLCVLPERKPKYETKIKRNNLNPVYNETFQFNIAFNELQRKTLQLVVFDFDRLSKDDRIGQLAIPLETVDFGVLVDEWKDLDPPVEDESRLGDICFSTRYRPATGTLTITIMEARNLKKMDVGGSSVPPDHMQRVHLIVSVWDYDKMSKNDYIGEVVLGSTHMNMQSISLASQEQWQEMMLTRRPVVRWHTLQSREKD
uniref:C2 domain-containing protein n=1 Tax=Panagrolaimus sp. ES5 TaxID=591445 RepID=A0AC34FVN1_9BILA